MVEYGREGELYAEKTVALLAILVRVSETDEILLETTSGFHTTRLYE